MNKYSTPFEADLAVGPPVDWLPPSYGRVRVRCRENGKVLSDNPTNPGMKILAGPLTGTALAKSWLQAMANADQVAIRPLGGVMVPWIPAEMDIWIEPLEFNPMTIRCYSDG